MKQLVSACVMAALVGLAVSARADAQQANGYTNADINGGYGCNVSGTLARRAEVPPHVIASKQATDIGRHRSG
jgi:hypothetical protein